MQWQMQLLQLFPAENYTNPISSLKIMTFSRGCKPPDPPSLTPRCRRPYPLCVEEFLAPRKQKQLK